MKYFFYGFMAVALFVSFDHMMRVDQENMCNQGKVECPSSLWIFK